MDPLDPVMQKLSLIDRQLKSLRYTFGIVLIILIILLALVAPILVKLMGSARGGKAPSEPPGSATYKAMSPVEGTHLPMGAASTTASTTVR